MRRSLLLLGVSLAGIVGGAWLIGLWAVGCAVIFDSLVVGVLALRWDVPAEAPGVQAIPQPVSLAQVLDRARAS